ncbi:uncharacterized protein LOC127750911 [Frankliniella occidentalis]|uniref:Uncharacterized protein LOC127750911 n=1 Tax=Frankliniella occidentalis TaxID=133901 RepID=A0A9C6X5M6_FRAOC|nr:uncharacterized protein LOC127750911 [Frankliniella occidentalis]
MDEDIQGLDPRLKAALIGNKFDYQQCLPIFKDLVFNVLQEEDVDRVEDATSRQCIHLTWTKQRQFSLDDKWLEKQDELLFPRGNVPIKDLGLILCFYIAKMPWLFNLKRAVTQTGRRPVFRWKLYYTMKNQKGAGRPS